MEHRKNGEKSGCLRCCKRDSRLSVEAAVKMVEEDFDITLPLDWKTCEYSSMNKECLQEACPYYK